MIQRGERNTCERAPAILFPARIEVYARAPALVKRGELWLSNVYCERGMSAMRQRIENADIPIQNEWFAIGPRPREAQTDSPPYSARALMLTSPRATAAAASRAQVLVRAQPQRKTHRLRRSRAQRGSEGAWRWRWGVRSSARGWSCAETERDGCSRIPPKSVPTHLYDPPACPRVSKPCAWPERM